MEPPVARSRGRPRKRRRTDEEKPVAESKRQVVDTRPIALVGRFVLKKFPRNGVFLGKVVYYECGLYRVHYEDGDCEDLDSGEVRAILVNDTDFDAGLTRRKVKLEELVSRISIKVADEKDKASADQNKEELKVDVPVSSELNNEEQDDGEGDDDESGDSSMGLGGKGPGTEAETLPLPPPLQLPPSSGTVGVPDQYVSHLFAVYGFLRSFSNCLFLTPFTLDDFVGALNCQVANTLFDAIHVSLMRALKHRLETVSPEGSEIASKCFRCGDWSLLDMLTWPVFAIQYLVINGYTKGPEWKGFYDEIFTGEYYLFPVSRKLMILQILCDDVLESEEMKAEMNMRKESEVEVDYDAEDIPPAEIRPRRVHPRYAKTSACEDKQAMEFASVSNAVNQPGNSISYFRDTKSTEDCDVDRNGDECHLCGMDGTLLCCDGCPSAYHSRCIGVMKMYIPEGAWYCPECKINMIGPTIVKGTSLRGGEIFGKDLYGQLFVGTCDHLLVLNTNDDKFVLKYYNQNDIPTVLQVLYESMQHRPMYYGICMAALQYWNIPESFLPLSVSTGTNLNSVIEKEETDFYTSLLPPSDEDNHKPVNLVKGEYPLAPPSLNHGDIAVPSLDASSVTTHGPAPESLCNASSKECPIVNTKLPEETRMESIISAGSVIHQSDVNHHHSVDSSIAIDHAKCSLVNSHYSNLGHANDMGLPTNFSMQTNESTQVGFGRCERNISNDFGYMGFSYKPLSYINYYMHGDFAASAAAKLAVLSSEESRSEGHLSDNERKSTAAIVYLQAKAFSLTASHFFWPSSEKKLVEVPRERCGWCFSCKAPVSSKRGCMLNHAALTATKSAMKFFAGFSVLRSGEGNLPSIATYIIYIEECLRGLIVGPLQSSSYRKQWRKQVEQATTYSALKPLLLELEENIRTIAFCGDWVKLMDDCLVESSIIQSAASSLGTTQKRAPSGRRYKKRSAIDEAKVDATPESFAWWRGCKLTKFVFQKAVLPLSMLRKAARRGGRRKISGIFYADGSEIPKRSRQLVWRVAVQMSRNASQLALQVRYLDSYLRWNDLIRQEQNIQDGKGQETEASTFRNANICDKKLVEGKCCYGVVFGSQKHLSSRVMKNVVEIEQGLDGKEMYWFSEAHIPLYLVKEYEEGNAKVPSGEGCLNFVSQSHKRRLKAKCKDIFFYLACKRDNLDMFSCTVCHMGVSFRIAFQCNACQGYCHEGCSISSKVYTNEKLEYLITCNHCHHAKLLALNETESPTSPLLLQGRENGSVMVLKGPKPKCYDQARKSARTKASSPDMNQAGSVSVLRGSRSKCHDQALTSARTKDSRPDKKQVLSDSTSAAKSRHRNSSWGIIWKKKNNETVENSAADIGFRIKNILLKGGSGMPQIEPVCHLCRKAYRSDLMYICCQTCQNWYHAEAVELEESKILDVSGFKCCKCRRIKSPECPYSDAKPKTQEGKRSRSRPTVSRKEHFTADSDSGTFSDMKECEPATPVLPVDYDHLIFSLSNVELITEPKLEVDVEQNTVSALGPQKLPVRRQVKREGGGDVDIEWNTFSGSGPQKLPVRRQVKREGDGDGSFGGNSLHAEFSTQNESGNLSNPAGGSSTPLEYGTGVSFDSNLLNDSASLNYELMDFEPHTIFSLTELLQPDGSSSQFEGADAYGDLSGYFENSGTLVPEECGGVSLAENSEPAISFQDDSLYCCWECYQTEPAPDLFCETCGMLIHSQCSTWAESPSRLGNWRCGNCREWQ